jgi:ech hydrogenase subunit D
MTEEQPIVPVTADKLVAEVQALREQGWRFVQLGATGLGEILELNYSFDREQRFLNLRLQVPAAGARLPSVSGAYWCAFLYENEIHDLFGVTFDGLVLDFKGTLYQTVKPFPFASSAAAGVSTTIVQSPV